jgi:geranylgeranyl pyrophosphate synthase
MKNLEEPIVKVQRMLEKDGAKGWNMAKEAIMKQETDNPQLKQALAYLTLIPDYFRPAIVSYCCEAVGGEPEITVPTGASLVLLAKAIGIHDDIIDNVKRRNEHATAYGKFGKEVALILSDILLFKGFTLMRKNLEIGVPPKTLSKILETIDQIWCIEQSESEILEYQSRTKIDVPPEECLTKLKKRASEFEAITRIGAILGKATKKELESLAFYGRSIGMISILRDELSDMLDFDVLRHRIKKESLPLPIIHVLQKAEVRQKLVYLVSQRKSRKMDLVETLKTVDAFGGIDYVAELINGIADEALYHISKFNNKELESLLNVLRVDRHGLRVFLTTSTNRI